MNVIKKYKKVCYRLAFVLGVIFLLCSLPTSASEMQKGSIKIELTEGSIGTSMANVVFQYERVADIVKGEYVLTKDYVNSGVSLNDIQCADDLDEAAKVLAASVSTGGQVITDKEGMAYIQNLSIGVYLLKVTDKARYEEVTPILIAIPTWSEEEGDMIYDVTVIPKHEPNTPGEIITNTPDGESDGVQTGDTSLIKEYFGLILVSVGLMCGIILYRNKRNKGEKQNET